MGYKYDPDLEFISKLNSSDLNELVYTLTCDESGDSRFSETLTSSEEYKRYYPEHNKYWEKIVAEIQTFGGNTLANIFRAGEGVLYKEILSDACDKLKVNYNKTSSVEKIEENLLMKICEDSLEKMSPDEIKELAKALGLENTQFITKQTILASFQMIFKAGGFKSYELTLVITNMIVKALLGRGLSLALNAGMVKALSVFTGPIGWTITGIWTTVDIAGPAYRVTIPIVIHIAALRKKYFKDS